MRKFILGLVIFCFTFTQTLAALNQTLKIGTHSFYPPFVFSNSYGQFYGFDIDIFRSICKQMNVECTFYPMTLKDMFVNLKKGDLDAVIGAISITNDRKISFDFTNSYYRSKMTYLVRSDSRIVDPNKELPGKKVGVMEASTFFIYLSQTFGDQIQLKAYPKTDDAIQALSNGKIDLVLMDAPVANYWVQQTSGAFKTVGTPIFLPFGQGYGIAIQKGNVELLNNLNQALAAIQADGSYQKLVNRYFSLGQ